ncbi:hypothetical protein VE01_08324 [Pseudogymnoascus verrucosus]|uniref:Acyltransferase 3 domain-containing protein n=1 Tax=Pseudogymnoascus verrucosus TaxID=342668 RepID=A0A1B8GCP7_9PEZI|nr:uncharacterized protein VE01_08324 [Pseudogymnoascus verrucosus]OBT93608.1 hypothetical protein VE01_08324 [Pseudogymnoascus verrucosus]
MVVKHENVKWVDGLRGLASVSVVVTHLARTFDQILFYPNTGGSPENQPYFLQWPIIRVFVQGRIGIAIFALVTGYVCALKPIRQSKSGNIDGALTSVAKSAFRRIPRLFLPTTIATCIMWVLSQLGAYDVAAATDSYWLITTSPAHRRPFSAAVHSLFREIMVTWTMLQNNYDPNQWTLQPLLKGSMMVYMLIFGTIYMQQKYRMMISLAFYVYFFLAGEVTFSMQFFFGMFLSDLSNHQPTLDYINARIWIRRFLPPLLMFIGLWIASYPEDHADWANWSQQLKDMSTYILLMKQDTARFYTGLGMDFICVAIFLSPTLKDVLSSKYLLWLGKNSFAVYLIHGTLIRTILTWCMYGMSIPAKVEKEVDGKMTLVNGPGLKHGGYVYMTVFIPLFFVLLYFLANLWTMHVDPLCARWTAAFERATLNESEKTTSSGPAGHGLLSQPPA